MTIVLLILPRSPISNFMIHEIKAIVHINPARSLKHSSQALLKPELGYPG